MEEGVVLQKYHTNSLLDSLIFKSPVVSNTETNLGAEIESNIFTDTRTHIYTTQASLGLKNKTLLAEVKNFASSVNVSSYSLKENLSIDS